MAPTKYHDDSLMIKKYEKRDNQTAVSRPIQSTPTDLATTLDRAVDPDEFVRLKDLIRPEPFDNAPKLIKEQIVQEQSYGLVAALKYSAFFTIIVASLSTVVLWSAVPHGQLLIWYGLLMAGSLVRHLICVQFNKVQPSGDSLITWLRWLWIASCMVGVTWCGILIPVWSVTATGIIAFVVCLLTGLAFGSFAGLGMHPKIYLGSALPQVAALILFFIHILDAPATIATVCMLMLFIGGVWAASSNSLRGFRSILAFMHRHQNLAREHRAKSAILSTILHSIGDGVLTVDRNGLVTYLNPAAERLTGLRLQDVVGKSMADGFQLTDDAAESKSVDLAQIFQQTREAVHLAGELVLTSLSVRAVSVEVTVSPLSYSPDTQIDGFVVTLHDVTLQRMSARELSRQALQDPLTGLINRRGFERRLQDALERKLSSSSPYCLCFIDLDRFKLVNDTCGHQAGDELLKQLTSVLQGRLRDADVIGRLGGDEFAILLCGCPLEKAKEIADSLCQTVADYRFEWEGKQYTVGASIGVTSILAGDTLKTVTEAADSACYQAKESGRGGACISSRVVV